MDKWEREAKEWRNQKRFEWNWQKARERFDTGVYFGFVLALLGFMLESFYF
ncbi:MAG TPA: hypothetical protein VMM76_21340 [Pirellulaceae bacterium]|nr:hypothetical protein [Pirellulaceae bacterium]